MTSLTRELRLAARSLRQRPTFTMVAVLAFALAIAVNTTMYSVLDAMLEPQIDVRSAAQIYTLRYYGDRHHRLDATAVESAVLSAARGYGDVSGSTAYGVDMVVTHGRRLRQTLPVLVRANFFAFLGTHALQGRLTPGAGDAVTPQAVISDRYADALFPNEPVIVGQTIEISGNRVRRVTTARTQPIDPGATRTSFTVVGVVRRAPAYPLLNGDVWIFDAPLQGDRAPANLVRVPASSDTLKLRRDLDVLAARLAAAAEEPGGTRFVFKRVEQLQFRIGGFHYALIGAVLAVLLVACANLANLQLARGIGRARELAVRSALGASRRELVKSLMFDVGLLAFGGLLLGLLLTMWGVHFVRASIPPTIIDYMIEPQTSWRLLVCAAAAAVACVVLVGLLPALRISRVDPNDLLKSGAGTGANRRNRRRYGVLLMAQIGLALPLLSGAVLLLRNAGALSDGDFLRTWYGYDPMPLVMASMKAPNAKAGALSVADVGADLVGRARRLPSTTDAAIAVPASADSDIVTLQDVGSMRTVPSPTWTYQIVTPAYLRTMGFKISRGRDFMEGESDVPVVIVDQGTARYLWQGADPVGRLLKLGSVTSRAPWVRVVGVTGDPRDADRLADADPYFGHQLGVLYRVARARDTLGRNGISGDFRLVARTTGSAPELAVTLKNTLQSLPGMSVFVYTMERNLGLSYWRTRISFVAKLFTTFALLGMALAALGIYGIVSHSIADRRRELAVRVSLGAQTRDIVHATIREGNVVALAGVAVGLYLTLRTKGWLSPFLAFRMNDFYNPFLFLAVAMVLFAIAAAAALIPALRAARVAPAEALRNE